MLHRHVSKFTRLFFGIMMAAMLVVSAPRPVSAASPSFDVIGVKTDESVTIRTRDFPANVKFIIRMDVYGDNAEDGIAVAEMNSGLGGAFEATIMIPAQLKGVATIAIRVDSQEGYFAYSWFTNRTSTNPPSQPIPVTGSKPTLTILSVDANKSAVIEARNLPANRTFTVRVGPYYSFFRDYVTLPSVTSDSNGYVRFTITLPSVVENVEMVTVRIDGAGRYAFNAFKNVTGGTTGGNTGGGTSSTTGSCQLISASPTSSVKTGAELDLVWTVKNTGATTWDGDSVDYKFVSGADFHKRDDRYDLHQVVKPGETAKVVVDVIAPSKSGAYTANWALVNGNKTICNLSYTLIVR